MVYVRQEGRFEIEMGQEGEGGSRCGGAAAAHGEGTGRAEGWGDREISQSIYTT
jgi:hypothetical protein